MLFTYGYVEDILRFDEKCLIRFQDGTHIIVNSTQLVLFISKTFFDDLIAANIILVEHDDLILEIF